MARSRASDFEEKRQAILSCAASVFASEGMEKASMSQIASRAGISKSLLYHYYPGKDALIEAIVIAHLETLETRLEEAGDPGAPARERLAALVRATLEAYRGADDEHKVQINAGPGLPEASRKRIAAIERRIVRQFSDVLCEIRPELATASPSPLTPVTMSLFGMMNWAYMWFRDDGPMSREQYASLATRLMLDGLEGLEAG